MKCLIQQFENDPYERMGSNGIAVPDSQWIEDINSFKEFVYIVYRKENDEIEEVFEDNELISFLEQRYEELGYNRPIYFLKDWYHETDYMKDWLENSDYFFITPLEN